MDVLEDLQLCVMQHEDPSETEGVHWGPARAGPRPAGRAGPQPMGRAAQASMIFCRPGRVRA